MFNDENEFVSLEARSHGFVDSHRTVQWKISFTIHEKRQDVLKDKGVGVGLR